MLQFLAELLGLWSQRQLDRLSERTLAVLNAVLVAVCLVATGLFLLAVLALLT
jgi:hypothetical protein